MNLVADLVGDSRINLQYTLQGLPLYGEVDRVFIIKDIGVGDGITDPQLFTSAALEYLQNSNTSNNVSQGSVHPVYTFCTARNWSVSTIGSNDAVKIVVGYVYNQIPYDPTVWTIESSTYTEFLETDQQYNSSNASIAGLVPIQINNYILGWPSYQNSSGAFQGPPSFGGGPELPQPPAFGTVQAAKIRKRWDYVRTIYDPGDAVAFDVACLNYVNTVNSATYLGTTTGVTAQNLNLSTGTVYCYDAGASYNLTAGQYIARVTMVWKPEGWQPWARYSNQIFGVPPNIWRAGNLNGTAYQANGTIQALEYTSSDLNALLALL